MPWQRTYLCACAQTRNRGRTAGPGDRGWSVGRRTRKTRWGCGGCTAAASTWCCSKGNTARGWGMVRGSVREIRTKMEWKCSTNVKQLYAITSKAANQLFRLGGLLCYLNWPFFKSNFWKINVSYFFTIANTFQNQQQFLTAGKYMGPILGQNLFNGWVNFYSPHPGNPSPASKGITSDVSRHMPFGVN